MNSIINLFIYEVKGPTPELYFREYIKKKSYFGKLLIKKDNNKTNTSIIPIELRETDKLRKNIISKIIELDKIIKNKYNELFIELKRKEEKKTFSFLRKSNKKIKDNLDKQSKNELSKMYKNLKPSIITNLQSILNSTTKEFLQTIKNIDKSESKNKIYQKFKLLRIKINEIKYLIKLLDNINLDYLYSIKKNNNLLFSKNILKNSNNNSELNITTNNIPFLYDIYKSLPARVNINNLLKYNNNISTLLKNSKFKLNLKSKIYDKMKSLFDENFKILEKYFNRLIVNKPSEIVNKQPSEIVNKQPSEIVNKQPSEIDHTSEIIYILNENEKCNIIVIGDNHGSFHSFFRIILRLYIKGIILENYTLKEDYKLILLGDIVDRGNFGIELLYILLNLMKKNNDENNLRVIIIRGNHEEKGTYENYGFKEEFNKKIKNNKIDEYIINFFKYCPSAIILNHVNTRYWLCHGGFDIQYTKFEIIKNNINSKNNLVFIFNINKISQIRWNDFSGKDETSNCSKRSPICNIFYIGNQTLFNFINYLGIDFIIRGHNDDYSNAMILKSNNSNNISNKYFVLNTRYFLELCIKNKNIPFSYGKHNTTLKYIDEILSINPKKFDKKYVEMINDKIYPVLTISNNSDKDRQQYSDSFLILSYKNNNENAMNSTKQTNNNQNNIRKTITSIHNYNKIMEKSNKKYMVK